MVSFKHRSYQKELLDRNDIPFDDIKKTMQELDIINKRLGGHDATLDGIVALLTQQLNFNSSLHIVEAGCGGGDNLRAIKEWSEHIHLTVKLQGIDINEECIDFAKEQKANEGIEFFCSDYKQFVFSTKPDIIFSSLFCHHFTDEELIFMLQWMQENSSVGFFINDLHRHPFAYYSIKVLTQLFSKSYLIKNDGPLSVLRSFKRKDWNHLFERA